MLEIFMTANDQNLCYKNLFIDEHSVKKYRFLKTEVLCSMYAFLEIKVLSLQKIYTFSN